MSNDKFSDCITRMGAEVHAKFIRMCELDMCASDNDNRKSMWASSLPPFSKINKNMWHSLRIKYN